PLVRLLLRVSDRNRDVTRLRVVQRRELLDSSPADLIDHAFAQPPVQVAHELGVRLCELAEGAVQELDARTALGGAVAGLARGLEAEPAQLTLERAQARARARALAGFHAPRMPGVRRLLGVGTDAL